MKVRFLGSQQVTVCNNLSKLEKPFLVAKNDKNFNIFESYLKTGC